MIKKIVLGSILLMPLAAHAAVAAVTDATSAATTAAIAASAASEEEQQQKANAMFVTDTTLSNKQPTVYGVLECKAYEDSSIFSSVTLLDGCKSGSIKDFFNANVPDKSYKILNVIYNGYYGVFDIYYGK